MYKNISNSYSQSTANICIHTVLGARVPRSVSLHAEYIPPSMSKRRKSLIFPTVVIVEYLNDYSMSKLMLITQD